MTHATEIITTEQLADRIFDHEDIDSFPEWIDPETCQPVDPGKWVVMVWDTATTQHLGDAAIHGPFDSKSDAESYR